MSTGTTKLLELLVSTDAAEAAGKIDILTGSLDKNADAAKRSAGANAEADESSGTFGSKASSVAGSITKGLTVPLLAAGAAAIYLGEKNVEAGDKIASSADISVAAGQRIVGSLDSLSGKSLETTAQIAEAYASVAGELGTTQGKALDGAQALGVMTAANNLAEASGESLASTTSDLATVMQAYGIKAKGAGATSDVLFNASRMTGTGLDSLTQTVQRLHSQLGAAAPSLQDTAGLMVDLTKHGETGRAAVSGVASALSTLLAQNSAAAVSSTGVASAQDAVAKATLANQTAQEKLAAAQQAAAASASGSSATSVAAQNAVAKATAASQAATEKLAYAQSTLAGSHTAANAQAVTVAQQAAASATASLTQAQAKLAASTQPTAAGAQAITSAQQAAAAAALTLQQAQEKLGEASKPTAAKITASQVEAQKLGLTVYDATGKFVGMQSVITQLQPKLAGLSEAQQMAALQALFGKSASDKLLATIMAGPAAYDKYTAAVGRSKSAQEAADKATDNAKDKAEKLKVQVENDAAGLGEKLLPAVIEIEKLAGDLLKDFTKIPGPILDIGLALAGVVAIGAPLFIGVSKLVSGVKTVASMGKSAFNFLSGNGSKTVPEEETTEGEPGTGSPTGTGSLTEAGEALTQSAEQLTGAAEKLSMAGEENGVGGAERGAGGEASSLENGAGPAEDEGGAVASDAEAGGMGVAGKASIGVAAFAAGYGIGTAANKQFHISDHLSSGIEDVLGMKQTVAAYLAPLTKANAAEVQKLHGNVATQYVQENTKGNYVLAKIPPQALAKAAALAASMPKHGGGSKRDDVRTATRDGVRDGMAGAHKGGGKHGGASNRDDVRQGTRDGVKDGMSTSHKGGGKHEPKADPKELSHLASIEQSTKRTGTSVDRVGSQVREVAPGVRNALGPAEQHIGRASDGMRAELPRFTAAIARIERPHQTININVTTAATDPKAVAAQVAAALRQRALVNGGSGGSIR